MITPIYLNEGSVTSTSRKHDTAPISIFANLHVMDTYEDMPEERCRKISAVWHKKFKKN